jgi:hypothetical protein
LDLGIKTINLGTMQNLLKRPDCGEQVKCKGEVGVSLSVTIATLTVDASTAAPLLVRMPDSKSTSNGCDAGSSSTSNEGIVVNISPSTAAASTTSDTEAPAPGQEDTRKKMQQMTVNAHANESVVEAKHVFWSTQPVPQLNSDFEKELRDIDTGCPIEVKTVDEISSEPVTLAVDLFEWSDVDVTDDSQLAEAYKLLNQNYVEDGDAMFRFDYSQDFLRWALMPPGWAPSWHVGVRVKKTGKLVAFITAVPATVRSQETPFEATGARFDSGNNSSREQTKLMAGRVYSRGCTAETGDGQQILPSVP